MQPSCPPPLQGGREGGGRSYPGVHTPGSLPTSFQGKESPEQGIDGREQHWQHTWRGTTKTHICGATRRRKKNRIFQESRSSQHILFFSLLRVVSPETQDVNVTTQHKEHPGKYRQVRLCAVSARAEGTQVCLYGENISCERYMTDLVRRFRADTGNIMGMRDSFHITGRKL